MADKTELIRQRMALKREALRQKLDALEDRTLGVVKETTEAVQQVAETVEDTVESATKAVKKTVRKSAAFLDIGKHVDEHPWPVMGGAVATGFALSLLLSRVQSSPERDSRQRREEFATSGYQPPAQEEKPAEESSQSSMFGGLLQMLAPNIDSLKHLAIGAAVGVLRDLATQAIPNQWSRELGQVFDTLTERLGGTPMQEGEAAKAFGVESATSGGYQTTARWEDKSLPEGSQPQQSASEPQQKGGKKKPHGNGRHSESTVR